MSITRSMIDKAFKASGPKYGGEHDRYFALLYLEHNWNLSRDEAAKQVAFLPNEYGVDGFHFDADRRVLYLLQFSVSSSYELFSTSLRRLIDGGIERIFGAPDTDRGPRGD